MKKEKAVILLSGGLDSATALYWAHKRKKWDCHCLILHYGQRHAREIRSARRLAAGLGRPRRLVRLHFPWGGSSLLNKKQALPGKPKALGAAGPLPSTYVPARNTIFLAYALGWADVLNAPHIVIGANALDYSGYPDCRPVYMRAMEKAARLATRLGTEKKKRVRLWTPLIKMHKREIVALGLRLGVPYAVTWSCYAGGARPCGRCESCRLRQKGFDEAGVPDPARV